MIVERFIDDVAQVPAKLGLIAELLDQDDGWPPAIANSPGGLLLTGMGSSWFAADTVALLLRGRGMQVTAEPASAVAGFRGSRDSAAVLISASGSSPETLSRCRTLAPSTSTLALTARADSELARSCDAWLDLRSGPERGEVACRSFRHTVAMLAAIGIPASTVARACRDAASWTRERLRDQAWVQDVVDVTASSPTTHWLASAELLASARQSALMMREVPRHPAVSAETGEWAHTEVYLTASSSLSAIVFTGSHWDEQAKSWLQRRRVPTVTVGRRSSGFTGDVHVDLELNTLATLIAAPLIGEMLAATRQSMHPYVDIGRGERATRNSRHVTVIGVPRQGAGRPFEVARGPGALRAAGLVGELQRFTAVEDAGDIVVDASTRKRDRASGLHDLDGTIAILRRLSESVDRVLTSGSYPLVLGGDCTILLGCLDALHRTSDKPGLLLFDGHEDLWPPSSTLDGAWSSSEVGLALGLDGSDERAIPGAGVLRPDSVAILGVRDDVERAGNPRSRPAGLSVVHDDEFRRDPERVTGEAVARVKSASGAFWVHLDVDVLNHDQFPATAHTVAGGISLEQLVDAVGLALAMGARGLSVGVYDPDRDPTGVHARNLVDVIVRLVAPRLD